MKPLVPVVQVVLSLPTADFASYSRAVRRLVRKIGPHAPDVIELMAHSLRCRDSHGLAEDYLESIHWPVWPDESVGKDMNRRQPASGRARFLPVRRSKTQA